MLEHEALWTEATVIRSRYDYDGSRQRRGFPTLLFTVHVLDTMCLVLCTVQLCHEARAVFKEEEEFAAQPSWQ